MKTKFYILFLLGTYVYFIVYYFATHYYTFFDYSDKNNT